MSSRSRVELKEASIENNTDDLEQRGRCTELARTQREKEAKQQKYIERVVGLYETQVRNCK